MKLVIDSLYAAPVAVWSKMAQAEKVIIEGHSFYEKGSYRNRCHIYGANGLLRLSVPIRHGKQQRTPIHAVEISYDHPWQNLHWQSLCAAYRRSPFFEFYEDDLIDLYQDRTSLLLDYNQRWNERLAELMQLDITFGKTGAYREMYDSDYVDGRNRSQPKRGGGTWDKELSFPDYPQIFAPKHGFLPNLSILDLLFHKGPESASYLLREVSAD